MPVICTDDSRPQGHPWPHAPRFRVTATAPLLALATCAPASNRKPHPSRCERGS